MSDSRWNWAGSLWKSLSGNGLPAVQMEKKKCFCMATWVCNVGIGNEGSWDMSGSVFWTGAQWYLHLGVDWNPKIKLYQSWCVGIPKSRFAFFPPLSVVCLCLL